MRKITTVFFCAFMWVLLPAQQTIFELWELPAEGCSLAEKQPGSGVEEVMMEEIADDWIPRGPDIPPGFSSIEEVIGVLGARVKTLGEQDSDFLRPRINWRDGMSFFQEDGKWGLKKNKRKALIEPTFDFILADTNEVGFVGYQGAKCNYYDQNGEARFSEDYLHIEASNWEVFIVQTSTGYGLLNKAGEELLAPVYPGLNIMGHGKYPYAHVRVTDDESFIYHIKTGAISYFSAPLFDWQFLNDRYAVAGRSVLIDFEKNRQVICGTTFNIKVVDWKSDLISVSRNTAPEEYYLINLEGKLISPSPFAAIAALLPNGMIIAGMPEPYKPGRRQLIRFGLINQQGEWVLPAEHYNISNNLIGGKFLRLVSGHDKITLINFQGDTLLPLRAYTNFELTDNPKELKVVYQEGQTRKAELLDLDTRKLTPLEEPFYWGKKPYGVCGKDSIFLAYYNGGEMLLNARGETLLPTPTGRIFKGREEGVYTTLKSYNEDGKRIREVQWIDCKGNPLTFKLQGQKRAVFNDITMVDKDFFFLRMDWNEGYFILPNGKEVHSPHDWTRKSRNFGSDYQLQGARGKEGLVDKAGQVIVPPFFDIIYPDPALGLVKFQYKDDEIQYLKADGSLLFDGMYDSVNYTGMGSFRVKKGNLSGLVDQDGKVLIPVNNRYLYVKDGMVFCANSNGEAGRYDILGNALD